jgi:hypothetical protein
MNRFREMRLSPSKKKLSRGSSRDMERIEKI